MTVKSRKFIEYKHYCQAVHVLISGHKLCGTFFGNLRNVVLETITILIHVTNISALDILLHLIFRTT